jgi:hypothetical protein
VSPRPRLAWIHRLPGAGSPIRQWVDREAQILDDIDRLTRTIESRKRDLIVVRAQAGEAVRAVWSHAEIVAARRDEVAP